MRIGKTSDAQAFRTAYRRDVNRFPALQQEAAAMLVGTGEAAVRWLDHDEGLSAVLRLRDFRAKQAANIPFPEIENLVDVEDQYLCLLGWHLGSKGIVLILRGDSIIRLSRKLSMTSEGVLVVGVASKEMLLEIEGYDDEMELRLYS